MLHINVLAVANKRKNSKNGVRSAEIRKNNVCINSDK